MQQVDVRLKNQRFYRSMRLMALVMVLAVTALFSMMPFKVPRVAFFEPQPAIQSAAPTTPDLRSTRLAPVYPHAAAVQMVHGKQDLLPDGMVLLPSAPLFSGTRALASLSVWKARRIAIPPPVRFRLRAPPAFG